MVSENDVIVLKGVSRYFVQRKSMFSSEKIVIKAVDNVNLSIKEGEVVALVGESGSGKTTTGRLAVRLDKPTKGEIIFEGVEITSLPNNIFNKKYRTKLQMIFQDPFEYLDPELRVYYLIAEPLMYNSNMTEQEIKNAVYQMMEDVQLTPVEDLINRRPMELSGGQRQRILIARSLILNPKFVVADEPTSMLDASTQMGVLKVIKKMQSKHKNAILVITHDMALAKYISNRIAVMYKGKIVEIGDSKDIIAKPLHPYTKALLEALPKLRPLTDQKNIHILPEKKVFSYTYKGCVFAERCIYSDDRCLSEEPELIEVEPGHRVACFNFNKLINDSS